MGTVPPLPRRSPMIVPGNINLDTRKVYSAPDGSYRTENSISIGTDQGEVLIPTIVNGQQVSNDEAIRHYQQTGENLGTFGSPDAADNYAQQLHLRQAKMYAPKPAPEVGNILASVRTQHPEYADMSDQQLADGLYKKFYSDMPRAEFDKKIGLQPPPAPQPQSLGDQLSAGFTSGVNSIPIAGPTILGGLESLKAGVQNTVYGNQASPLYDQNYQPQTQQNVAAADQAQVQANPVASTVGQVAGNVLPFMAAPGLPLVGGLAARGLGMAGGLGSRVVLGGLSGAGISAADTAARGGSGQDIANSAMIGGGVGVGFPLITKGAGALLNTALGRNVPKSISNVARALKDDQIPASEVNQRLANLGPDSMVMDLGPNLQRQAGAVAAVPGEGQFTVRNAVSGRQAGARGRVEQDVAGTLGTGPELAAMQEQVIAAQKAAADPLYARVRPMPVKVSGNLQFVLNTPMGKRAFAKAQELAANDGARMGPFQPNAGLTVGDMDYVKQALDDIVSTARRSGENNIARQATQLSNLVKKEVDAQVPLYKQAREAFAGHAQVLDAMDAGSAVFTKSMTPGQLKQSLAGMSSSERDAFLQAARSAVEAQMGNATNDALALRNMFKKSWNEDKLRLILGDATADDLLKRISREAAFGQTTQVVTGNSETAARTAAMGEVAPGAARTWRPEGPVGILLSAFDAARNKAAGVSQPRINSQMATALTASKLTPEQLQQLARAARPGAAGWIAPAAPGLLATQPNGPVQITIHGGGR